MTSPAPAAATPTKPAPASPGTAGGWLTDVRERWIPVGTRRLAEQLAKRFCRKTDDGLFNFDEADRGRLLHFSEKLFELVRREADGFRDRLVDEYEAINPDRDTLDRFAEAGDAEVDKFLRQISYVLERAGYRPLSKELFQHALDTENVSGVEVAVDFDAFDFILMFERARGAKEVATPGFMNLYETKTTVDVIGRLGMVFKMKGQPGVYVKVFKDIPLSDLEAVLPGSSVRMSKTDKIWLLATIIPAGLATIGLLVDKFFAGEGQGLSEGMEKVATGVLIAAGGAAYKVYYSWSVLRDQATGKLAKQLYYQQLDGNAGVVSLMLDAVAQQEARLALTAYLMTLRGEEPATSTDELDKKIEEFLRERYDHELNFDMPAAVETLQRFGLWRPGPDGRPGVVPLDEAIALVSDEANARRAADHHLKASVSGDPAPATVYRRPAR